MMGADTKPDSLGETKIWSSILQQVRQTDTKKLPADKFLLVLGDSDTGKTTLIARLAGQETPKKGSGLEYNFIEIRDDYREESTKLGSWILNGDLRYMKLLNFALTETNYEDACCLLVASMSQPWNIMRSLETWAGVLEKHLKCLFSETSVKKFQGIELVVVITKSDYIPVLEKDHDYTEETLDFIQQAIRKFCLRYGASLFYVSAKHNKNCDLLKKYLANRIYKVPFDAPPSVVERDAIFVPSSWDSEKKISILYDNIRRVNPDDEYNSFINEPSNSGLAQRDVEVEVENDQDFLSRMQCDLGKQIPAPTPSAPLSLQPRPNITNPIDSQPSGEGVLQNFFNSLLSKGRAMPPNGQPEQ